MCVEVCIMQCKQFLCICMCTSMYAEWYKHMFIMHNQNTYSCVSAVSLHCKVITWVVKVAISIPICNIFKSVN